MTMFGTYAGNYAGSVQALATYIGRNPDLASVHVGQGSWSDIEGSPDFNIYENAWKNSPICVTVPLCPNGELLPDVGAGKHNGSFLVVANKIKAKLLVANDDKPVQSVVYVRLGQEFNLSDLWPWSVGNDVPRPNNPADYVAAWRAVAGVFRAVDARMLLVWCPNTGWQDPWPAYPGDDVVDVVGLDMYSHPGQYGEPAEAMANWNYQCGLPFSPGWLAGFGKSRGKPICFPEWGINDDTFGPYIQAFHDWCVANNVLYANYWDSDGAYHGCISNGQYPTAGAVFRACFGAPAATPGPVATPVPVPAPPLPVPTPPALTPKGPAMPSFNLRLSGDSYQGAPVANITVDGAAIPDVTVTAAHGGPSQVVAIPLAAGSHTIVVTFGADPAKGGDLYGGAGPGLDRNLYVDGADLDGADCSVTPAALFSPGSVSMTVSVPETLGEAFVRIARLEAKAGLPAPAVQG